MKNQVHKIAIIGGGISGLTIAEGLLAKGYSDVTLYEKEQRVGGKLQTLWYKGKSYEFGALFGLPSQKYLKSYMKARNIKVDGPKLSRINYDAEGQPVMQIPKESLLAFVEELDRLPEVLSIHKSLEFPYIHTIETDLALPFSKWCDLHDFKVLKIIYAHHFTSYGLGFIDEMPAIYVLKIMNYDNLMSFMELPEFCTWKEGVSTLIKGIENRIPHVRCGQQVLALEKVDDHQVTVVTEFERKTFDAVILTCPLNGFSSFYAQDAVMQKYLNAISYMHHNVYAFVTKKVPASCGCILSNLHKERVGHPIVWNARWTQETVDGEEILVMVYAYNPPNESKEVVYHQVVNDLHKVVFENLTLYQFKTWLQSPHVNTEILADGFYNKLHDMQGVDQVYLAGEIMSTVTMDSCIRYSKYLVDQYF